VKTAELTEELVGSETERRLGEGNGGERSPVVFAEGAGNGFLADEGELLDRVVVL
jgi:hypothetical protein